MSFTHYSNGERKVPRLATFCEEGRNHRLCGGWWCVCPCHDDVEASMRRGDHVTPHLDHEWGEVGPCVYCKPCGTRLYQGKVAATVDAKERMALMFGRLAADAAEQWSIMRREVERVRGAA